MKINMHRVDGNGNSTPNGKWWVWTETCDKCGKLIWDENTQCSCPYDESEVDFCVNCMRELMDKDISYEQASAMYGKSKQTKIW